MLAHSDDTELDLLERIYRSRPGVRQRDLARVIGLSLGMTNAILKRLAGKGWLKVKKVNTRNFQYIVSARGVEEIARRSYRYFRRTVRNIVAYKEILDELIGEVAQRGYRAIRLIGSSDLDFILEHLCAKHHLEFERLRAGEQPEQAGKACFRVYAETQAAPAAPRQGTAYLQQLILRSASRKPLTAGGRE
jgi:DNA-binding MarR family transcriptional regulator